MRWNKSALVTGSELSARDQVRAVGRFASPDLAPDGREAWLAANRFRCTAQRADGTWRLDDERCAYIFPVQPPTGPAFAFLNLVYGRPRTW